MLPKFFANSCFSDLCNFCKYNKVYLPGLESFLNCINFPNLYWIYYDFFLRCVPGNKIWMKKIASNDKRDQLITVKSEAYAMIVLENNYNAWMYEEKEKGNNLVTEYDIAGGNNEEFKDYTHLVDALLPNIIIDFIHGEEEKGYLVTPQCETFLAAANVQRKLIEVDITSAGISEYNIKNKNYAEKVSGLLREGKKRKALSLLREYTKNTEPNGIGTEKKYRGWSCSVGDKMREYVSRLKSKEMERNNFQVAYKFAYLKKEELLKPKVATKDTDDYEDLIEDEEDYKKYNV